MTRTRRPLIALAATLTLMLAGCGEDPPPRAGTIDDPGGSTEATQSGPSDEPEAQSEGEPDTDLDTAGRRLTKAEARAALPRVNALPAGWSVDPENTLHSEDGEDADDVVKPKRCAVVFEAMEKLDAKDPAVKQDVTFMAGALGPFLGVAISSYEDEVSGGQFTQVLESLGECPKFSVDDGSSVTKFSATSLSFPNLGEESLAIRMTGKTGGMTAGIDYVAIRTGHNIVGLAQVAVGGASRIGPLKKAAEATMRNLAKTG